MSVVHFPRRFTPAAKTRRELGLEELLQRERERLDSAEDVATYATEAELKSGLERLESDIATWRGQLITNDIRAALPIIRQMGHLALTHQILSSALRDRA